MRAQRASGPDGLAGMSAVVEIRAVRILRPVLACPRAQLQASLIVAGQGWIDDPSNRNPDYLRVKLRSRLEALDGQAAVVERLQGLAARFGRLRAMREAQAARLLARTAMLHPAGFAVLDPGLLLEAPEETALKALAAVLTTVSGADYPPRRDRLERLFRSLPAGLAGGRTLQGCVILPHRGGLLIARELAATAPPAFAHKNAITHWDGRFALALGDVAHPLWIGALGGDLRSIRRDVPTAVLAAIPPAARATLPALRDAKGVVAVPALRYFAGWLREAGTTPFRMVFRPTRPAADAGFRIV
jgi:tRNA(Ile)-lysidine synthase